MARERAERPRGHRFSMPAARPGGAVELRVGQAAAGSIAAAQRERIGRLGAQLAPRHDDLNAKNDTIVPVQSILDCVALIWKCPAAPRQRADHLAAPAAD